MYSDLYRIPTMPPVSMHTPHQPNLQQKQYYPTSALA
jgi:hypothetical protein